MMQHKFEGISGVSLKGLMKLDKIAQEAARVAHERESASKQRALSVRDSAWVNLVPQMHPRMSWLPDFIEGFDAPQSH